MVSFLQLAAEKKNTDNSAAVMSLRTFVRSSVFNPALFRWNWGGLAALITLLNGPQNLKTISMSLLFTFDFSSNPLRYKCCPGS